MKKKLLCAVLSVTMVSSILTGCGSKGSAAPAEDAAPAEEKSTDTAETTDAADTTEEAAPTEEALTTDDITLKVWESTGGPDEFIRQAGEKFTEKYPNIKIEFSNVEAGDTTTQIALDGPAGVGADVFVAPHDKLGELVSGGHILPVTNPDDLTSRVLNSCADAVTYDGTVYGYPVAAETYALYYNRALISDEEVPKTWEDLKTWVADFNSKNKDKQGFLMDVGNGYYSFIFTTSENNRLFGESGTDSESTNINSEASVKGMEFFQSLREVVNMQAEDMGTDIDDGAFAAGSVAMYISGPWNISTFKDAGIDFNVVTLPALPGNDTPAASFSGTRGMFVSAYTDYPAESQAFANFLTTEEMQQLRYELTGALPSIDMEVDTTYAKGFLEQLDYAFPMPSIPAMGYFWDAMNNASANIWNGADIQTELDEADAAMKQ